MSKIESLEQEIRELKHQIMVQKLMIERLRAEVNAS